MSGKVNVIRDRIKNCREVRDLNDLSVCSLINLALIATDTNLRCCISQHLNLRNCDISSLLTVLYSSKGTTDKAWDIKIALQVKYNLWIVNIDNNTFIGQEVWNTCNIGRTKVVKLDTWVELAPYFLYDQVVVDNHVSSNLTLVCTIY